MKKLSWKSISIGCLSIAAMLALHLPFSAVGAGEYEGIYDADGKIGIAVERVALDRESGHADETLTLTATLRIKRTTDIEMTLPQGSVVFRSGDVEIAVGSITSITVGEDGYIRTAFEADWTAFAGEHLITAAYIPSESDRYSVDAEGEGATALCSVTAHIGGTDTVTCTEQAICELCGVAYSAPALSNHVGETHIEGEKEATCSEEGYTGDTVCDSCGTAVVSGTVIGMLEHELTVYDAQAPTCTEIGWEAYEVCANCEYTTYAELAAAGHGYIDEVVPPTVSSEGYTLHTCELCGDSYRDSYIDRLDFVVGDVNEDDRVASDDAIYLLRHTLFPDLYPLSQTGDFNADASVDSADAIYLLRHTLFPDLYPLVSTEPQAAVDPIAEAVMTSDFRKYYLI